MQLIEIRDKVESLVGEVESLEQRLCLAVLGEGTSEEELEQVDQWEEKFFRLKLEIYQQANPSANTAYLSIYGDACEKMRPIYAVICADKNFEVTYTEIWFRESLYFSPNEDGKTSEQYLLVEQEELFQFAPEYNDRLIGLILKINGPAVQLFFSGEEGVQKWHNVQRKEQFQAEIKVSEQKNTPPRGIHLKNYFSRLPVRRTLEFPQVKDNVWRINRQIVEDQYINYLLFQLEQQFKLNLDNQF